MDLWKCSDHKVWKLAEERYWDNILEKNRALELEMDKTSADEVKKMSPEEFCGFLKKYIDWQNAPFGKKHKKQVEDCMDSFDIILKRLFESGYTDTVQEKIELIKSIDGIGLASATGILALIFPEEFGAVSGPTVESLKQMDSLAGDRVIQNIKPQSIKLREVVYIERLLQKKAAELNAVNNISYWTPRKIDKVLWACAK